MSASGVGDLNLDSDTRITPEEGSVISEDLEGTLATGVNSVHIDEVISSEAKEGGEVKADNQ